jgi:hypothetical protein
VAIEAYAYAGTDLNTDLSQSAMVMAFA